MHFVQVENEELRKELQEKQEILCQAAKAMELMGDSQKNSNDSNSAAVTELMRKIEVLEVIHSHDMIYNYDTETANEPFIHSLGTNSCYGIIANA